MSRSRMDVFAGDLSERVGRDLRAYADLWEYSVTDLPGFWRAVWDYFDLGSVTGSALGDDEVLAGSDTADTSMQNTRWMPGVELNYVDAVLAHADRESAAIVGLTEDGERTEIAWNELPRLIGSVVQVLSDAGVGEGDVVAGYLPDIPEAVIAFLATASLGAIWSGCGQDYAPEGAAGRLAQLNPTVLFSSTGYRFNGKDIDRRAESIELAGLLGVGTHIVVGEASDGDTAWADVVATPPADHRGGPVRVPFDHPLWVLFSSGTTGKPKGIVHGHGGVLLEHLKETGLHADLGRDSVFFWHTALSWMMWNFQIAGLLVGARIVCYSGSPLAPDADRLWQIVADENVTYFGTSPGQLQASRKAGLVPGRDHDLSAVRTVGSTGSTLAADLFTWVDDNVQEGLPVSSISGGTDIVSAFAGGSAGVPVVAGELSVRHLGVALESWSPQGTPLVGEVGEMVITEPMPSMPIAFWNDPDGERYRKAYFAHEWDRDDAPVIWRHGDWVTLTDRGSLVIHGRSDATLNRNGIRMGSADIYEVVEAVDEVAEAFVLGVDGPDGKYWMPVFVTLVPDAELTDELVSRIAGDVKTRLSARHVPDEVIVAPGIPHTRTGKKLEVPVTAILAGRSDVNIDPKAVDDYALIDWYTERGRAHEW